MARSGFPKEWKRVGVFILNLPAFDCQATVNKEVNTAHIKLADGICQARCQFAASGLRLIACAEHVELLLLQLCLYFSAAWKAPAPSPSTQFIFPASEIHSRSPCAFLVSPAQSPALHTEHLLHVPVTITDS